MESEQIDETERKQTFLKKNIVDKGYLEEIFIEYVNGLRQHGFYYFFFQQIQQPNILYKYVKKQVVI